MFEVIELLCEGTTGSWSYWIDGILSDNRLSTLGSLSSTASLPIDDSSPSTEDKETSPNKSRVSPVMVLPRDPRFAGALTKEEDLRRLFDPSLQWSLKSIGKPLRNSRLRQRKHQQSPIRVKHLRQRKVRGRNLLKYPPTWMSSSSNLTASQRPLHPPVPRKEISVKPSVDPCRRLKYTCFSELTYCDIQTCAFIEESPAANDCLRDETNIS